MTKPIKQECPYFMKGQDGGQVFGALGNDPGVLAAMMLELRQNYPRVTYTLVDNKTGQEVDEDLVQDWAMQHACRDRLATRTL